MGRQLSSRVLEAIDADVVLGALVLVGLGVLADLEPIAVALLLGIVVGVPVVRTAAGTAEDDGNSGIATVAFGAFVVAAGGYSYQLGDRLLGPALALVGAWLVLDGVATWRYGDVDGGDAVEEDLSKAEFAALHDANRVLVAELRAADRPLTVADLESRTELPAGDVERLLELHGGTGPVERVESGYVIDEAERGLAGFVRYLGRTVGGRLLRPVRLYRSAT